MSLLTRRFQNWLGCAAVIGLASTGGWTPAQYRDGTLPPIPVQAVGGGEVFLEVSVSSSGGVLKIRALRATAPFTELVSHAVRGWRFAPAVREVEPATGKPGPAKREPVDSNVLVAGIVRPPTINTPTLGEPAKDVGKPSNDTPFPLASVTPPYPPLARDSGTVLVQVLVGTSGRVADAKVIRSSGPFDDPALAAARQWTFRPARERGAPVETFAYLIFAFRQPITIK